MRFIGQSVSPRNRLGSWTIGFALRFTGDRKKVFFAAKWRPTKLSSAGKLEPCTSTSGSGELLGWRER